MHTSYFSADFHLKKNILSIESALCVREIKWTVLWIHLYDCLAAMATSTVHINPTATLSTPRVKRTTSTKLEATQSWLHTPITPHRTSIPLCLVIFTIMVITRQTAQQKKKKKSLASNGALCLPQRTGPGWRRGIDRSRHIRARVKINLLHYEACGGGGGWARELQLWTAGILYFRVYPRLDSLPGSWWILVRERRHQSLIDFWGTVIYCDAVSFFLPLLYQASLHFSMKTRFVKRSTLSWWLGVHFYVTNVGSAIFLSLLKVNVKPLKLRQQ